MSNKSFILYLLRTYIHGDDFNIFIKVFYENYGNSGFYKLK